MGIWTRKDSRGYVSLRLGRIVATIIPLVVILMITMMSIAIVPAGSIGVHDLFGEVEAGELQAGLHFKHPLANINMMSIKTQEYTMSYAKGEGAKHDSDVISALTKEGLSVDLDITILYKMTPNEGDVIYKTIGMDYVSVIVRPQIRTGIREVVAGYEAKQIYSQDRAEISIKIFDFLEADLADRGIILEDVLLRHVQLPKQLTQAIEDKLTAEQNIEKKQFDVEVEKQEANRKRVEAQGIADAQTIIDESLTPEYLRWYWIENLDTHNSVIYVPIDPEGMINLGSE